MSPRRWHANPYDEPEDDFDRWISGLQASISNALNPLHEAVSLHSSTQQSDDMGEQEGKIKWALSVNLESDSTEPKHSLSEDSDLDLEDDDGQLSPSFVAQLQASAEGQQTPTFETARKVFLHDLEHSGSLFKVGRNDDGEEVIELEDSDLDENDIAGDAEEEQEEEKMAEDEEEEDEEEVEEVVEEEEEVEEEEVEEEEVEVEEQVRPDTSTTKLGELEYESDEEEKGSEEEAPLKYTPRQSFSGLPVASQSSHASSSEETFGSDWENNPDEDEAFCRDDGSFTRGTEVDFRERPSQLEFAADTTKKVLPLEAEVNSPMVLSAPSTPSVSVLQISHSSIASISACSPAPSDIDAIRVLQGPCIDVNRDGLNIVDRDGDLVEWVLEDREDGGGEAEVEEVEMAVVQEDSEGIDFKQEKERRKGPADGEGEAKAGELNEANPVDSILSGLSSLVSNPFGLQPLVQGFVLSSDSNRLTLQASTALDEGRREPDQLADEAEATARQRVEGSPRNSPFANKNARGLTVVSETLDLITQESCEIHNQQSTSPSTANPSPLVSRRLQISTSIDALPPCSPRPTPRLPVAFTEDGLESYHRRSTLNPLSGMARPGLRSDFVPLRYVSTPEQATTLSGTNPRPIVDTAFQSKLKSTLSSPFIPPHNFNEGVIPVNIEPSLVLTPSSSAASVIESLRAPSQISSLEAAEPPSKNAQLFPNHPSAAHSVDALITVCPGRTVNILSSPLQCLTMDDSRPTVSKQTTEDDGEGDIVVISSTDLLARKVSPMIGSAINTSEPSMESVQDPVTPKPSPSPTTLPRASVFKHPTQEPKFNNELKGEASLVLAPVPVSSTRQLSCHHHSSFRLPAIESAFIPLPERVLSKSNSPVTRSHCKYHILTIPGPDQGRVTRFIVPSCSLSDSQRMEQEGVRILGEPSLEDNQRRKPLVGEGKVETTEDIEQSLTRIVGLDLVKENHVFYLDTVFPAREDMPDERSIRSPSSGLAEFSGFCQSAKAIVESSSEDGIIHSASRSPSFQQASLSGGEDDYSVGVSLRGPEPIRSKPSSDVQTLLTGSDEDEPLVETPRLDQETELGEGPSVQDTEDLLCTALGTDESSREGSYDASVQLLPKTETATKRKRALGKDEPTAMEEGAAETATMDLVPTDEHEQVKRTRLGWEDEMGDPEVSEAGFFSSWFRRQ